MRRAWTTTEAGRVKELRKQRVPMRDIAKEIGRSEVAIYSFLRYIPAANGQPARMGNLDKLPPLPPRAARPKAPFRPGWDQEEIEALRDLAQQGLTAKEAAKIIGRSYHATRSKACQMGIPFINTGKFPIERIEQEMTHYRLDAIRGSAMLRDAILQTYAPELLAA